MLLALGLKLGFAAEEGQPAFPTIYVVGDSTVHNSGTILGWGDVLEDYFDTAKVRVVNCARPGRSTRSFRNEGAWAIVLARLKPGDFVFIQFGHNDQADIERKDKVGRGTLPGEGPETVETSNTPDGKPETVHSYGWYLARYVREVKDRRATPIVFSPVPRGYWNADGSFQHVMELHARSAERVARNEKASFVDLEARVSRRYEEIGRVEVMRLMPEGTHTTREGAQLNARLAVEGLNALGNVVLPFK